MAAAAELVALSTVVGKVMAAVGAAVPTVEAVAQIPMAVRGGWGKAVVMARFLAVAEGSTVTTCLTALTHPRLVL